MSNGWSITCGKCGAVNVADFWLDSAAVLVGTCHFQCPACGVMVRRVARGVQEIEHGGCKVFVPANIKIEEVEK